MSWEWSGVGNQDVSRLNSKFVLRDRDKPKSQDSVQIGSIACYTRERVKIDEKNILQHQQHLMIYIETATLEMSLMLQCTV
jgi:hypothetical protein